MEKLFVYFYFVISSSVDLIYTSVATIILLCTLYRWSSVLLVIQHEMDTKHLVSVRKWKVTFKIRVESNFMIHNPWVVTVLESQTIFAENHSKCVYSY